MRDERYSTIMGKITIDLPDHVIDAATHQSDGNIEAFIREAVEAAIDYGAPERVKVRSHEELVRKLEEGLNSGPARPLTEADFARWRAMANGEQVERKRT